MNITASFHDTRLNTLPRTLGDSHRSRKLWMPLETWRKDSEIETPYHGVGRVTNWPRARCTLERIKNTGLRTSEEGLGEIHLPKQWGLSGWGISNTEKVIVPSPLLGKVNDEKYHPISGLSGSHGDNRLLKEQRPEWWHLVKSGCN